MSRTALPMPFVSRVAETADAPAPPDGAERPEPREQTERQDVRVFTFGQDFFINGGSANNPCGFPGYGRYYAGDYATYRFMLNHPRIRHARRIVEATIKSNEWGLQVRDGTPDNVKQFVESVLTAKMIRRWKREAFRALDFGWYPFEKVWRAEGGRWVYDWLKPLAVDANRIVVTAGGRFAGIRFKPGDDGVLPPRDCVCHTHDGEAGDLYGRCRLENIREYAWREWLDAATQLQWTCLKIAGKLAIIQTPSGSYVDANGDTKSWRDLAMAAGKAIADVRSNGTVWMPGGRMPEVLSKENIDYAKIALTSIDVKDFGSHSEAITGFLDRMRAAEDLMAAGYLRSSRTMMESKQSGSRADSEQHTDTDTADIEDVDLELSETFNEQVVDPLLTVNFGDALAGAVFYVPAKLTDEHVAIDNAVLKAGWANQGVAGQLLGKVGWEELHRRRDIPVKKGATFEDIEESVGNGADTGDETPPPEDEGEDDADDEPDEPDE